MEAREIYEYEEPYEMEVSEQEEYIEITEADVFNLYGRLVEPLKQFEDACAEQASYKESVENAKAIMWSWWLQAILYTVIFTVVLAIPFAILFWNAGKHIQIGEGANLVETYYEWYKGLEVTANVTEWCKNFMGLFTGIIGFVVIVSFEMVVMPCATFLVPIVAIISLVVSILGAIHASSIVAGSKAGLPARQETIEAMLEELEGPLTFVPPDYRYSEAVEYFYKSFANHKADTLKEAVNLYDNYVHQRNMEESQQVLIQNQVAMLQQIEYQNIQLQNINSKLNNIKSTLFWHSVWR